MFDCACLPCVAVWSCPTPEICTIMPICMHGNILLKCSLCFAWADACQGHLLGVFLVLTGPPMARTSSSAIHNALVRKCSILHSCWLYVCTFCFTIHQQWLHRSPKVVCCWLLPQCLPGPVRLLCCMFLLSCRSYVLARTVCMPKICLTAYAWHLCNCCMKTCMLKDAMVQCQWHEKLSWSCRNVGLWPSRTLLHDIPRPTCLHHPAQLLCFLTLLSCMCSVFTEDRELASYRCISVDSLVPVALITTHIWPLACACANNKCNSALCWSAIFDMQNSAPND